MNGEDMDLTDLLQQSIDRLQGSNVTPILPAIDLAATCCAASKLRHIDKDGAQHFESWCIVHHHWLNGAKAQTVLEREMAYLQSLIPEPTKESK